MESIARPDCHKQQITNSKQWIHHHWYVWKTTTDTKWLHWIISTTIEIDFSNLLIKLDMHLKKTLGYLLPLGFKLELKIAFSQRVLGKTPWIIPPRNLKCQLRCLKICMNFLTYLKLERNINTFSMFTVQTNNRHQLCLILFKSFLLRAKFDKLIIQWLFKRPVAKISCMFRTKSRFRSI